MKFRQFALAMALILEILAMHVLTLVISMPSSSLSSSSSSLVDVATSVNEVSVYYPRKTTILEDIALSGANLDKRHRSADVDLQSSFDMLDDKISSMARYCHYLDRQQADGSCVFGLGNIDECIPIHASAMCTSTVDVCDVNSYLIVHSHTLSTDGGPGESAPSAILKACLAKAALFLRQLSGVYDIDTQVNPSLSVNVSSSLSCPGAATLLIKRNSIEGHWVGKSWIIGLLPCASLVLSMLISCFFRYRREENARNGIKYNYRRHEWINKQAYVTNNASLAA